MSDTLTCKDCGCELEVADGERLYDYGWETIDGQPVCNECSEDGGDDE